MKKYTLAFFLFCFFSSFLFADEIHLKDGAIIKGAIIQVTQKNIEYDPPGSRPFDLLPLDQAAKIIYDDGRKVYLIMDEIYMKDGAVIKGRIVQVTVDSIFYFPEGSDEKNTTARKDAAKIVYGNGEVVQLSEDMAAPGPEEPPKIQRGGFHDSIIKIGIIGGVLYRSSGEIEKAETRIYDSYKYSVPFINYMLMYDCNLSHVEFYGGYEVDLMLPSIKYYQRRGIDFTGVKFGVRGRYLFADVVQNIQASNDNENTYNKNINFQGDLLKYKRWEAGPVVNFIFSPRKNIFNILIQTYVLYGQIIEGKLTAAPALRDGWFYFYDSPYMAVFWDRSFYYTSFRGYTISAGIGNHFVLNRWFPVTIGYNFNYTHTRLKYNRRVPLHNNAKDSSYHSYGIEFALGIHL